METNTTEPDGLHVLQGQPHPDDIGAELRQITAAVRLSQEKLGIRRALEQSQIADAAETFGASARAITAAKKLLDTSHPAYRAVTRVRSNATQYWRLATVPYPEPGIRLIRRDRVSAFEDQMEIFRAELADAAGDLQAVYAELRSKAAHDLGSLFNPGDYPPRVDTCFSLAWDYPSTDPPKYLEDLAPELYRREQERIAGKFAEAVRLTEEAFETELAKLVEHLSERLAGDVDGKPQHFRNSTVENLRNFVGRFRELTIAGSSAGLDQLVSQAEQLVANVTPDDLRASTSARDRVAAGMSAIRDQLDGLMVERAKRAIDFGGEPDTGSALHADGPYGSSPGGEPDENGGLS